MNCIVPGLLSRGAAGRMWPKRLTPPAASFNATDITGVPWGKDFKLTDHTGHLRSLKDFRGKVVAMFFGYTHCPDVCPTTLSEFAMALKADG